MDEPFSPAVADGVRAGEPDAFGALWRAVGPALVRWLASQVRDDGVAEDLAQEAFLSLVRHASTVRGGPRELRSWLYRAAYRDLLDWRRSRRRRPETLWAAPPDTALSDMAPASAEAAELRAAVRDAISELPADQSAVITLRFLGDLTAGEVAEIMHRTEGSVRALQHRAVASLGRLLSGTGVWDAASSAPEVA